MVKDMNDYYIEIESAKIEISSEPVKLQRCQLVACDPSNAYEECFVITKDSDSNELIVHNVGFDSVSVNYCVDRNRVLALPKQLVLGVSGIYKVVVEDDIKVEKQSHFVDVDNRIDIIYGVGEIFKIYAGDVVCVKNKVVLRYSPNVVIDDEWM